MGSGVSRRRSKKVELQRLVSGDNSSNLRDVSSLTTAADPSGKTTGEDMESSSSAQNGPNIKIMLSGAETCAKDLKSHLSDGTVASKEVVTCCMELLKFSCSVDESEECKTAAVHFLLEKNIPGLIYEIYGALLAKYPDVTNYDREKVEVRDHRQLFTSSPLNVHWTLRSDPLPPSSLTSTWNFTLLADDYDEIYTRKLTQGCISLVTGMNFD